MISAHPAHTHIGASAAHNTFSLTPCTQITRPTFIARIVDIPTAQYDVNVFARQQSNAQRTSSGVCPPIPPPLLSLLASPPASYLRDVTFSDKYHIVNPLSGKTSFYVFAYRFDSSPGGGAADVASSSGSRGENVAHGANAAFVGKNLTEILKYIDNDAVDGEKLHRDFVRAAQSGGGWVSYPWLNKRGGTSLNKIAFVAGLRIHGQDYVSVLCVCV